MLSSNCFLIGMEKITSGTSQTEKLIQKTNKKRETQRACQKKEEEVKIATLAAELDQTQEQVEELQDIELAKTAQQLNFAQSNVGQFVFFSLPKLLSTLTHVDCLWLRESKHVKWALKTFDKVLTQNGML